jgi:hypothetical protein
VELAGINGQLFERLRWSVALRRLLRSGRPTKAQLEALIDARQLASRSPKEVFDSAHGRGDPAMEQLLRLARSRRGSTERPSGS